MGVLDRNSSLYSIRGRVGALVVSSNATTSFVKAAVSPRQTNSPDQRAQKSAMILIMQGWASLTALQRSAWVSAAGLPLYARSDWFGNSYNLTGQQLYVAINRNALAAGIGLISVPSVLAFPALPPASSFVLNSSVSGLPSTWSFAAPLAPGIVGTFLRAKFARGYSVLQASIKPNVVVFRYSSSGSPFNITAALVAAFGVLPLQYTCFFQTNSCDAFGRVTAGQTYTQQSSGI